MKWLLFFVIIFYIGKKSQNVIEESGTLVGIMFSLVTYKNNSVWGSVLLHVVWNMLMISNIVLIYNGVKGDSTSIFSIVFPSDNPLLTGAGFGVEASVFAIIGYAIVCGIVWFLIKRQGHKDDTL